MPASSSVSSMNLSSVCACAWGNWLIHGWHSYPPIVRVWQPLYLLPSRPYSVSSHPLGTNSGSGSVGGWHQGCCRSSDRVFWHVSRAEESLSHFSRSEISDATSASSASARVPCATHATPSFSSSLSARDSCFLASYASSACASFSSRSAARASEHSRSLDLYLATAAFASPDSEAARSASRTSTRSDSIFSACSRTAWTRSKCCMDRAVLLTQLASAKLVSATRRSRDSTFALSLLIFLRSLRLWVMDVSRRSRRRSFCIRSSVTSSSSCAEVPPADEVSNLERTSDVLFSASRSFCSRSALVAVSCFTSSRSSCTCDARAPMLALVEVEASACASAAIARMSRTLSTAGEGAAPREGRSMKGESPRRARAPSPAVVNAATVSSEPRHAKMKPNFTLRDQSPPGLRPIRGNDSSIV